MIPLLVAFVVFSAIGLSLTVRPTRVRDFIIDACVRGKWGFWIARNVILRRVQKPGYTVELRLIGIVSLLGAVACAWIFLAEHFPDQNSDEVFSRHAEF